MRAFRGVKFLVPIFFFGWGDSKYIKDFLDYACQVGKKSSLGENSSAQNIFLFMN